MDNCKKRAELLAPAAGFISVKAAFNAGADAVYIGGEKFGARAYADNMKEEDLLKAIDYAHLHDRNLYLTVNTLLKEEEIENQLYNYLLPLYEQGLDAVIVQDMGVLDFIKKYFPKLAIHASTQMAITGEYAPLYLKKLNVERIVTARELSLAEIKNIHDKVPDMEIESFIHGALCMGYSGMCFFSSSLGDRSGNRGRCAQSCRLNYNLLDENGKKNDILKDKNYCLSPKDLCTINLLPQIIDAGVYSLKIEGRMKRAEYAAGVTAIYRKYLDKYLYEGITDYTVSDEDFEKLSDLYNRGGFTEGYYNKRNGTEMMSSGRPNHFGVFVGTAKKTKNGLVLCARTKLNPADVLELRIDDINPGRKSDKKTGKKNSTNFYKKEIDLRTEVRYNEFTVKEQVAKGKTIVLPIKGSKIAEYDKVPVFRMKNESLLSELHREYIDKDKKIKINCELNVVCGEPIMLNVSCYGFKVSVKGSCIEAAVNHKTDKEQLIKNLKKTGQTPFECGNIIVNITGDCFVPVKLINEIRRSALEKLEEKILFSFRRKSVSCDIAEAYCDGNVCEIIPELNVSVSLKEQAYALCGIKEVDGCYIDMNAFSFWTGDLYKEKQDYEYIISALKENDKSVYISLPVILRMDRSKLIRNNAGWLFHDVDGILVHNFEQLCFVKALIEDIIIQKTDIIADYSLYQMNSNGIDFLKNTGVSRGTFPIELTKREITNLSKKCSMPMELICYGYMPMMFTAQCQKKNSNACNVKPSNVYLQDRMGKKMLVHTNCDYCYNTVYNSEAFSLIGLENDVKQLSTDSVRLNFTKEDADTMKSIICNFTDRFYKEEDVENIVSSYTRGHFRKGVE